MKPSGASHGILMTGIHDRLERTECQSILKKAFEGRLVAQDPNDEPAGVLLERIKAQNMQRNKEKESQRLLTL